MTFRCVPPLVLAPVRFTAIRRAVEQDLTFSELTVNLSWFGSLSGCQAVLYSARLNLASLESAAPTEVISSRRGVARFTAATCGPSE